MLVIGSLRQQFLYPNTKDDMSDQELLQLLEMVNVAELAERFGALDAELDWEKVLSVGEQQRLAIARVLLEKPHYAMLDEATIALDTANEERLYRQLRSTSTTLVSVSHHSAIVKYHDQVLQLSGGGAWQLLPVADYRGML